MRPLHVVIIIIIIIRTRRLQRFPNTYIIIIITRVVKIMPPRDITVMTCEQGVSAERNDNNYSS